MKTDDYKDLFDDDLQGLDQFEPSMRFAKNVVEQVKAETELLKPQRGGMYWIPRICMAGFGLIALLFAVILGTNELSLDFGSLIDENPQIVIAIIGIGGAVPAFLLLDRLFRKAMLS